MLDAKDTLRAAPRLPRSLRAPNQTGGGAFVSAASHRWTEYRPACRGTRGARSCRIDMSRVPRARGRRRKDPLVPLGYPPMNRSIGSMLLATFVLRVSTAITGGMLLFLVADVTRGTGTGPSVQAFLSGGFYATELTGAIVFGVLADRYGRKVIMLLGPVFGGVAVFMTGLTTHLPILFVTRLLEGGSTAASIPSTLGFIAAETSNDEKLRGRVVSIFELVSLGGMLAVGPALAGVLWENFGRPAFFVNCVSYAVALCLYAYGVHEVPRNRVADIEAPKEVRTRATSEVSRYLRIATNRKVLLFAPTWLAINAILGLWALQAPLLLRGNIE